MASGTELLRGALSRLPSLPKAAVGLIQRSPVAAAVPGTMSFDFGRRPSSPWWRVNWFQTGTAAPSADFAMRTSAVFACVSVLAQEVARIEMHLWKFDESTGRRWKAYPDFERVLRRPNSYQSRTDFWLNAMMSMLLRGNFYAVATRREGKITQLHPVPAGSIQPVIVRETGDVFYHLADWQLAGATEIDLSTDNLIPSSEVLHLRAFTPAHPLLGASPLSACGPAVQSANSIAAGAASFFSQMSRPSGFLQAPRDIHMSDEAAERVRARWRAATSEAAMGGIVVIGSGYTWTPLTLNAADAQMIEQYRMTVEDIARVFRVPMHALGDLSRATFSNVDGLQRSFIVSGLGFYLSHIENAVGNFFGLAADEYCEFDIENAMMRPEFESRMNAYAKAVQGGIYSPNEIRAEEHLPAVKGGDTIFLQRQMTPVDALVEQAKSGTVKPADPAPTGEDGSAGKALRPGASRTLADAVRRRSAQRRTRRAA